MSRAAMTSRTTPGAMKPFDIRRLGPADVALMQGLLKTFGEVFGQAEAYGAKRPGAAYLRRLLGSDTFIALAALVGDEVAGGIGAYVMFVQADLGDDAAIALYSKLGTREDVLHFDVPVMRSGA